MKSRPHAGRIAFGCGLLIAVNVALPQGNLAPPGAPSPTFKTLAQVEPRTDVLRLAGDASNLYVITNAGSYYLTTNVVGAVGQNGIGIQADNVTLDLNGFALIGVPGSVDGINLFSARTNVVVRNGLVRGWGGAGVNASNGKSCSLEDVLSASNLGDGMRCSLQAVIRNCRAHLNGGSGIAASEGSLITGCIASSNNNGGIILTLGTISACTAYNNANRGFSLSSGCVVSGCTANGNTLEGFYFGGQGNSISGCSAMGNSTDGILVGGNSLVLNNTCHLNVGAGINTQNLGTGNRIEGNLVTGNARGIDCNPATNNVVIRNIARANTNNYDVLPANFLGTVVTSAGAMNSATNSCDINISF